MEELKLSAVEEAAEAVVTLEDRLLVLRLSLGKLRAAFYRAFAPIAQHILPALTAAIHGIIGFLNDVAAVLGALFGTVQEEAKTTVKTTGSAVKRALADFDQLDRLSFGGGGSSTLVTIPAAIKKLPRELEPIVEKLRQLLEPLQSLDLSAAKEAFEQLRAALEPLTRALFSGLEWAWFNLLVPMSQWSLEQALPAFLGALTEAVKLLGTVIQGVKPVFSWLWERFLQPLAGWTGDLILWALGQVKLALQAVSAAIEVLRSRFSGLGDGLASLKEKLLGGCEDLKSFVTQSAPAQTALSTLKLLAEGLGTALGVCAKGVALVAVEMKVLLGAMGGGIKTMLNSLITIINTVLTAIETVLNSLVEILNSFGITIPDWVPGIGGKSLNLGLEAVELPRVPALARGAVLPPNKPFLAVVGDQKQGTNIEAPLDVIEAAVANAVGRSDGSERLLAQILEAITNIRVGDETIGRAARRYEQRWAVMGGVR